MQAIRTYKRGPEDKLYFSLSLKELKREVARLQKSQFPADRKLLADCSEQIRRRSKH